MRHGSTSRFLRPRPLRRGVRPQRPCWQRSDGFPISLTTVQSFRRKFRMSGGSLGLRLLCAASAASRPWPSTRGKNAGGLRALDWLCRKGLFLSLTALRPPRPLEFYLARLRKLSRANWEEDREPPRLIWLCFGWIKSWP